MPTGLTKQVVDIFLSTLNQVPGDHTGPVGRLTRLVDCIVKHYVGPGQVGERTTVEAREAFQAIPETSRNVVDGNSTGMAWNSPELIGTLGQQLVSVSNEVPRVYSDTNSNWSGYLNTRVLADKLEQEVYHTSDHTIQVPDGCQVGDSTGETWTETSYTQAGLPIGSSWFGIKSKLGAWVTLPRQLYAPNDSTIRCLAKCVSDGSRFWVFHNEQSAGPAYSIVVDVYSEQGQHLSTASLTQEWQATPGYWDVTYQAGTVLFAQPVGYSPPTDTGIQVTKLVLSGSTIVPTTHSDGTAHCNGGVAWMTNDLGGSDAFLITLGAGNIGTNFHPYVYRIPVSTLTQTHLYDTGLNLDPAPDSLTGFTSGSGNLDVNVVYSMLARSQVHGPVYDPALRNLNTQKVTFAGVSSAVRTTQSVIAVSRAFARDGLYYVYSYYQSGSGNLLVQTPVSVTVTPGDYMLGNGSQDVNVIPGDYTTGAPIAGSGGLCEGTFGAGSGSIGGSDTVLSYTVVAGDTPSSVGVPVGSIILAWTFAALVGAFNMQNSNLTVTGSSIVGANDTFRILAATTGGAIYTQASSKNGLSPTPGTFTATGTAAVTDNFIYYAPGLELLIKPDTAFMFNGAPLTVTGASHSGNNGTFNITGVHLLGVTDPNNLSWQRPGLFASSFVVGKTTQSLTDTGISWSAHPLPTNGWHFQNLFFDSSFIGSNLAVAGTSSTNDGVFAITGTSGGDAVTAGLDASGTLSQIFRTPVPTVTVELALSQVQYTFFFQSITFDYSYIGAQIQVINASHGQNDGVYTIYALSTSDVHTVYARPTNGLTNQVNEAFNFDTVTIALLKANQIAPEFQPIWFITPLDGSQPQVGAFERGLAYADWRFEGQAPPDGPNTYPLALSSPFVSDSKPSIVLPYRAKSFTAGQTVTTPTGTATSIVVDAQESTIGLKRFRLDTSEGLPVEAFNELLLPGPLAGGFTSSGFHEQGVNLGPEQPWLVTEFQDAGAFGVSPGEVQVKVVYEWMDDNGERGFSYPSPPLVYQMQAPNNTAIYGGRLPLPLDSNGNPTVVNTYGVTNRQLVGISLYRTATVNGVPSTQLYKITNDLNVNGLYLGGSGSGFTFPNSYTWNYVDQSLDAAIVDQESLYTSKGLLPRYPAPPFVQGDTWENRSWLVGYDRAVWCSGDKTEGDGNWFFPGFRLFLAGDDAVAVQKMEQYLVIGGKNRMWYIPAQSFPNNTGTAGSFPTPAPLPFPNGCTGFMATSHLGTVYSSSAGGLWVIGRDLKNLWLSEPIKDQLGVINGLAVDQNQRIAVSDGGSVLYVYDPVPATWYSWNLPSGVQRLGSWRGQFVYQDSNNVLQQVSGAYLDTFSGGNHPIEPDLTVSSLTFSSVRGVKRVWEFQSSGQYKGPHTVNIELSYPDDTSYETTSFGPFPADPTVPYVIAFNPANEEASAYQIRYFAGFDGVATPGNSFVLELFSAEVGVDRKQGIYKLPTGQRVSAN